MVYESIEVAIRELKEVHRKNRPLTLHELESVISILEQHDKEVEELKEYVDYLEINMQVMEDMLEVLGG